MHGSSCDALFKELDAKIDRMSKAINEGGDANAEQLGKDLGGLLWQVGSVVTGAGGLPKALCNWQAPAFAWVQQALRQ